MLSIYLTLLIHELGHMVGGLAAGFRFVALRIGHICLIRSSDRVKLCLCSGKAFSGQCIMVPGEKVDLNYVQKSADSDYTARLTGSCRLLLLSGAGANIAVSVAETVLFAAVASSGSLLPVIALTAEILLFTGIVFNGCAALSAFRNTGESDICLYRMVKSSVPGLLAYLGMLLFEEANICGKSYGELRGRLPEGIEEIIKGEGYEFFTQNT